jgi:hypothetical protein
MAQTTGGISGANAAVWYSTDAAAFTAIAGYAITVDVSGGEAITGSQQTFDGTSPIVTAAHKVEPLTIEVSVVYTETDTEPFDAIFDRFMGATKNLCVRYSPNGGASGDEQFTTTDDAASAAQLVPIVSCNPPSLDASSGDPRTFTFSVIAPRTLKETIA